MNILYIHDRPSGGAGESLFQMVSENSNWKSSIIFTQKGYLQEKFDLLKTPIFHENYLIPWTHSWRKKTGIFFWLTKLLYLRRSIKFIYRVIKIAKQHKIDCIHTNTLFIIEAGIAAKLMRIPHVIQIRELVDLDFYTFGLKKHNLIRYLRLFSDKLICNSDRTLSGIVKISNTDEKLIRIYNAIDTSNSTIYDLKSFLKIDPHKKIIAILGWITPRKRVEDFIAVAKNFQNNNDYVFVIIGGWASNKNYNEQIKEQMSGCSNIIHAGIIPSAAKYLKSVDVLLCPCYTESFGRTVAEAMSYEVPVIGIADCAVAEIIDQDKTGYLVGKGDTNSMTYYLNKLLNDDSLRLNMGRLARQAIIEKFNKEKIIVQYNQLYKELINNRQYE